MIGNIFKKLSHRTIFHNIKLFLSVVLIVFLSSMLLSGFICNYQILNNTISTYFEKTNLADILFYVDGISESDEEFLKSNNIDYGKRLYIETRADISSGYASNNAKIYVYDGKISNPYKENGKWGCVIDKNVFSNNNLKFGEDKLIFSVSANQYGYDFDLKLTFDITGSMSHSECADSFSSWPIFITEEMFLKKVNESANAMIGIEDYFNITEIHYNQILVKTNNIEKTKQLIENHYAEDSENSILYAFEKDSIESVVLLSSEISQAKQLIYVFPVIFLVVSILIILTTINQLVLQERQKIGMLKSIGISNKIIMNHYSKFGAIFCFVGSVLGVIFGIIVIPSIMFIKYKMVYSIPNDYISFSVPILYVILVVFGLTILGYIVSSIACKNILKKKPIELLKFNVKSSKIKGFGKLHKLPFSIKMAIRNLRLKPGRTFMAIVGITGCIALLLCGFGIRDTITNSVNYDFDNTFYYDISTTYTKADFESNLRNVEGVTYYEKYEKIYVSASLNEKSKNVNLFKLRQHSILTNVYLGSGEVFLSKSIADDLNVKVNDTITIVCGSETRKLKVTKIITTSIFNGIYVCDDLNFEDNFKTFGMWIECDNVTKEKIDYINSINGTNTARTIDDYVNSINEKISSIDIMTNTLKFFAISLVVVVMLSLILLILKERVRELATLKVLGRSNFKVLLSLFFEILIMMILGGIVGIILGKPLLVFVLSINKIEAINYMFKINFVSFVLSALIVILTTIIIMAFCYRKIVKINMIESLKSVE